jgi:hypothetical protein
MNKLIPESKEVINTIIEEWFDRHARQFIGSRQIEELKESLHANLSLFKDLD